MKTHHDVEVCCPACEHKFNRDERVTVSKPLRLIDNLGVFTMCSVGLSQTGWWPLGGAPTTVGPVLKGLLVTTAVALILLSIVFVDKSDDEVRRRVTCEIIFGSMLPILPMIGHLLGLVL